MRATHERVRAALRSLSNPRRPWLWLIGLFVLYSLLGWFLVPWLVQKNIEGFTRERLHAETLIERVRFNPWALSLGIEELHATDESGAELLGFGTFYMNFQASSLLRWAWSFKEFHLLDFYARFERFSPSDSNIGRLLAILEQTAPPAETEVSTAPEAQASPPRLLIKDLHFHMARLTFVDHVPATDFNEDFGPLDLKLVGLSTLPDRVGQQELNIETLEGARLRWLGEFSLTPLTSTGLVKVSGPHLDVVAVYLADQLNFELEQGTVDAQFHYEFSMLEQTPQLKVTGLQADLSDFLYVDKRGGQPLLAWQSLAVTDGALQIPQNRLHLPKVDFSGGRLWVSRAENGDINLAKLLNPASPSGEPELPPVAQTPSETKPWEITNDRFAMTNWEVNFEDKSLRKPAQLHARDISFELEGASNLANQPVVIRSNLKVAGGEISSQARLTLNPVAGIEANFALGGLALDILQPYISEAANATLDSGTLNIEGDVLAATPEQLQLTLTSELNQFLLREGGTQDTLLSWEALTVRQAQVKLAERTVEIDKVMFDRLYADFEIDADGRTTIDHVLLGGEGVEPSPDGEQGATGPGDGAQGADDVAVAAAPQPLAISVGSIVFADASARFADANLPLPYRTDIRALNGSVSSLQSNSSAAAEVKLKGQVDEYGEVEIAGSLAAFAPTEFADVAVGFRNVNVPDLTPYSIKFAGREIDQGRMDLKLNYAIDGGMLDAQNTIVLYDLQLGERVEQPGAMDLPLDLALALLKDGEGKIDLDLPVAGDVNDPQFGVGSVIGQAITKVITSIVASPFRLLGKLVGAGAEELETIRFDAGTSDIAPPEKEKIHKLAKALAQRPNLSLTLRGVFAPAADGEALQAAHFDRRLAESLGEEVASVSKVGKPYMRALEKQYRAAQLAPELAALEAQYRTFDEATDKERFDTLAYVEALRQRLIAIEPLPPQALRALAEQRLASVEAQLLAEDAQLRNQLTSDPAVEVKAKSGVLNMPLKLSAN